MRRMLLLVGALAVVAVGAVLVSGASGSAGSRLAGGACSARWRVVATGVEVPLLGAVAATSSKDVWAVGRSDQDVEKATPVIVHWDGKRLRSHSGFMPSGRKGILTGVAAVASDDVWAVGWDVKGPVVLHWDGRAWKRATTPRVRGNGGLDGITAISSSDVWAIGENDRGPLVMHWNGRAWSLTSLRGVVDPNTSLSAVDAAASHDIWTVGHRNLDDDDLGWAPVSLHWDGRSWKRVGVFENDPGAGSTYGPMYGSVFAAVDVSSPSAVWTLGHDMDSAGGQTYILRWDGRKQRVAYEYEGYGILSALAAISPTNVWAVGQSLSDSPLVVQGDGKSLRDQRTPLDGLRDTTLEAVTALSATEIWAVGNHLVARYSC